MTAFRVCIIAPPGYPHVKAFLELALLLKSSFADRSIPCDYALNTPDTAKINIMLGYHLIRDLQPWKGVRYIPWQLEQLSEREGVWSAPVRETLANALTVWDYSHENIAFLRGHGIDAVWLPPGYHAALERIDCRGPKDCDILFYGSVNERRRKVLQEILAHGRSVNVLFGAYGEQRDAAIARSSIILNIHHYSAAIFESVRISYLLNNGCCVVSENSTSYPYAGVDLCMAPYEQLAQTCLQLLDDDRGRASRANGAHAAFKNKYSMDKLLSPVLGRLPSD